MTIHRDAILAAMRSSGAVRVKALALTLGCGDDALRYHLGMLARTGAVVCDHTSRRRMTVRLGDGIPPLVTEREPSPVQFAAPKDLTERTVEIRGQVYDVLSPHVPLSRYQGRSSLAGCL